VNDAPDFIHRFEPATEEGRPTLLLLHGTGGSEDDLVPLAQQLAPGAAILSPRGKVLEGGVAARFFRRHAEGVLDVDDLKARTDELALFVRKAAGEYGFDSSGLVALGFSNGANVATALLFRHPDLLAGAALLRPMLPYLPDLLPDLTGKHILVDAGTADPMVPADQPPALAELLTSAGAEVTFQLSPGAGHGLSEDDLNALVGWFQSLPDGTG
jgi:phospholipase/carboxylesterase